MVGRLRGFYAFTAYVDAVAGYKMLIRFSEHAFVKVTCADTTTTAAAAAATFISIFCFFIS